MMRIFSMAVVAAAVLQGCMFAPGQYMDTAALTEEGGAGNSRVELIPITPKLLAMDAATQVPYSIPAELLSYKPGPYLIGANDALYITVWDHPELTAPSGPQQQIDANGRLVSPEGNLFYPYVGEVVARGRSIEALRGEITDKLRQYIDSPQVDVSVLRFASQKVVISGAVVKAGPVPITTIAMNVSEALGLAGIDPINADLSNLTLTRGGKRYSLDLDTLNLDASRLSEVYLKDGDQLYLAYNDRKRIYVMGEVMQPRALSFKTRSMNLSDVLGSVGGVNQNTSNADAIYVIRGAQHIDVAPAQVFQLEAASPAAMALATRFDVQPQDVVFVGPANITRWNRFISQLVPSASIIGIGASTQNNLSEASSR
ncbi:polysaccharide biosynthesis/export family protein [Pseudomonas fluorescens]|uniref:polysaccharide biosynthesis/export family protein n=1 Tax=Pseudomonas fluorescens TaxID=294 RepID=UPI00177D7DE4|nr:polysaccharide biosynthesis/export family protein [Pseudomonas fluorescens]MBD8190074.1 polysaccharide biosynthesis/export family protein [Pseudomonas fluorescens]MBD8224700.1 polysaccharide biosynthesis/export family protein [Pseudomonas fluorescens]MBD8783842.1 polysaccharide biosynthesis/export family protein [Pseudomonas fluorescens]MBD8815245.1 polysaccharide biosynthesis/export family protein [Pseudomonas fluorescens]